MYSTIITKLNRHGIWKVNKLIQIERILKTDMGKINISILNGIYVSRKIKIEQIRSKLLFFLCKILKIDKISIENDFFLMV